MMTPFSLERIEIKLDIDGTRVLHLMLTRAGTINRMGDGSGDNLKMAMGRVAPDLFQTVAASVPPDWWEITGRYSLPAPKGAPCELEIGFGGETQETGIAFLFGSQSEGPPADIMAWVDTVLEATEPWYQDQAQRGSQRKR